ncbi:MAG TPA: acyl-CoA dehydratase activase [Ignavibacteriaceae bacterium]|nr:acyl-CoA dehydratase activase [Ignavibacteriaceae bacterium]
MKQAIGACLGASSISFVRLSENNESVKVENVLTLPHNGDPRKIFKEKLLEFTHTAIQPYNHPNGDSQPFPIVVTGRKFRKLVKFTTISEPEATEYAFTFCNKTKEPYSAVASLGGETFMVYTIDDEGKVSNVITGNQCASGTGEFFLQQIKRMDIGIDEVVRIAKGAEPFKVSGRCSVFCKSDCTHALNKGVRKSEVAAGLSCMMAEKVENLLKKVRAGKVMVVGGVTKNFVVIDFLMKKVPDIFIPAEASYFEALGAALYGLDHEVNIIEDLDDIFIERKSSFVFHHPLKNYQDKVQFKTMERGKAEERDICILGLDVGSTTTKAVVIRKSDNKILGSVYLYTLGNPVEASRKCYAELLRQIPEKIKIIGLGTTGSGRQIAGLHALTDGVVNEIVAHAAAAVYFDPDVDTIFEIGGQDAKYTYIINKVPADYAMNEACSAGTGSFIEESAHESLGIKVTDIEPIAMKGDLPPNFSDQCSAFISSDIKTAQQENISKENIVAGLVYSICLNYVNRVKGNRPVGKKIFMQGGVCYNKAIPIAMSALTGKEIIVPPEPGLMGAFGVALEIKEKIDLGLMQPGEFSLKQLADREVGYKKPFICIGGKEKCDLACTINLIEVEGKTYPFGGACNKYYNIVHKTKVDVDKFDYIKKRHYLTFEKYCLPPIPPQKSEQALPKEGGVKSVGINQSFHTHTIYPLYYNFFTKLGFKVVLSDTIDEKGLERENTSFCYPAQISLELFADLISKNPDYYFIPEIFEMYVDDPLNGPHRLDFNCTCVFVSGEPFYLKQAFKDIIPEEKLITPFFNFANGFDKEEEKFIDVAKKMGVEDDIKIKEAFRFALKMQEDYQNELFAMGKEFIEFLKMHPEEMAIVLVGRPYNSFTELANKGIPKKFASRGVYVVPFDMFDYRSEMVDDNQYWEGGKKILKAARIIKNNPQLFATYVSNFSCGPDSMLLTTFRSLMGTKPSLTLELDGHTADAGINTRIDAALDIIKNYRKIQYRISDPDYSDFIPARIEFDANQGYFITSEGEKLPLSDPKIDILIPSMGDLAAPMFAAGLRSQGFNTIPMPEGNPEILKYGRSVATGKECLPLLLCVGSLLDYIENKWDGKQHIAFFIVQGAGNCRLGQYPVFIREIIKRKRLKNVTTLVLMNEDGFAGLGPDFSTRGIQTLMISDVLDDIRSGIMAHAVNPDEGLKIFYEEYEKLNQVFAADPDKIYRALKRFTLVIKNKIPAAVPIHEAKYIAMCGEIYVRRDHFSHKWLNKHFAQKGFILKDSYISEWVFYVDYLLKQELLEPETSYRKKLERLIRVFYMKQAEYRIKKILSRSGYYKFSFTKVESLLKRSKHVIPLEYKGEPGLTLGVALHETIDKYCGVINLGPFGCMPTRFTEAVSMPEMKIERKLYAERIVNKNYTLPEIFNGKMNIPFLTIETDGNVYPQVIEARLETFALQAERVAGLMKKAGMNGYKKNQLSGS